MLEVILLVLEKIVFMFFFHICGDVIGRIYEYFTVESLQAVLDKQKAEAKETIASAARLRFIISCLLHG